MVYGEHYSSNEVTTSKETNQAENDMFGDSAGNAAKLIISVFPPTHNIKLDSIIVEVIKTGNKARRQKVIDGASKLTT